MTTTIRRDELKARIDRGDDLAIVEALPPMYYQDAHLPGALNLPHDQVDALAPALLPDKSRQIVVYCSNTACQNSGLAAAPPDRARLHRRVDTYADGKQDWVEAGLPTESGAALARR